MLQQVMKFAEMSQEVQITRPTVNRVDLGFTPGRRLANQVLVFLSAISTRVRIINGFKKITSAERHETSDQRLSNYYHMSPRLMLTYIF